MARSDQNPFFAGATGVPPLYYLRSLHRTLSKKQRSTTNRTSYLASTATHPLDSSSHCISDKQDLTDTSSAASTTIPQSRLSSPAPPAETLSSMPRKKNWPKRNSSLPLLGEEGEWSVEDQDGISSPSPASRRGHTVSSAPFIDPSLLPAPLSIPTKSLRYPRISSTIATSPRPAPLPPPKLPGRGQTMIEHTRVSDLLQEIIDVFTLEMHPSALSEKAVPSIRKGSVDVDIGETVRGTHKQVGSVDTMKSLPPTPLLLPPPPPPSSPVSMQPVSPPEKVAMGDELEQRMLEPLLPTPFPSLSPVLLPALTKYVRSPKRPPPVPISSPTPIRPSRPSRPSDLALHTLQEDPATVYSPMTSLLSPSFPFPPNFADFSLSSSSEDEKSTASVLSTLSSYSSTSSKGLPPWPAISGDVGNYKGTLALSSQYSLRATKELMKERREKIREAIARDAERRMKDLTREEEGRKASDAAPVPAAAAALPKKRVKKKTSVLNLAGIFERRKPSLPLNSPPNSATQKNIESPMKSHRKPSLPLLFSQAVTTPKSIDSPRKLPRSAGAPVSPRSRKRQSFLPYSLPDLSLHDSDLESELEYDGLMMVHGQKAGTW